METCQGCGKVYEARCGDRGIVCSLKCWGSILTKRRPGQNHPTGKGGKRADLGDKYFRSRWEANWARYLNWLKSMGNVKDWQFEPDTFEFVGIKRGARFYTPDFKVFNDNGSVEYHEIKGWNTPESKTKLKRMAKYHPHIKIVLIQRKEYGAIARQIGKMLPCWEWDAKKGVY